MSAAQVAGHRDTRPNRADAIVNGGFESGLSPWTGVGTGAGAAKVVSGVAHSGSHSAFMGTKAGPAVTGLHGVSQSVVVPSGGVLSFWYIGGSNDTAQYADQEVDLTNGSGKVVFQCWKGLVTTSAWTQQSCDVSAYAGQTLNVTIGVNDNGFSSTYVYLYVDDVSLTGSAPTPSPTPSGPTPPPTPTPVGGSPIQHVVVIIQENRSVDNLFQGFPGADTVPSGKDSSGHTVPLSPVSLTSGGDRGHLLAAFLADTDNGRMDGWIDSDFGYVPRNESQPYWDLASQYVLADRMFSSNVDASFVSHQYYIAAGAHHSVDNPTGLWGCDGPGSDSVNVIAQASRTVAGTQFPCFDYPTIGDELDGAGISWRYYAPKLNGLVGYGKSGGSVWSAYQAVKHIRYGNDWKRNVVSPETQVLTDIGNGNLPAVTWITPSWVNSDHSGSLSSAGPSWVATVVNAIGAQPSLWNHVAIFIVWDDWGGWYDHVPPPYLDNEGAGIRVPMIVVSPFAKSGYVSHVQYESTSTLKFIENQFGLASLTQADARAADPLADCFNLNGHVRPFRTIRAPYPRAHFLKPYEGSRPPDD